MKVLSFSFETRLRFSEPVLDHDFVLRCLPTSSPSQTVLEAQTIFDPRATVSRQCDGFGNLLQVGRLEAPHKRFEFISAGTVVTEADDAPAEEAHPIFLRPRQMTEPGPHISDFVADVLRVCGNVGPLDKALRLSQAIHETCSYEKGTTDVRTTAEEALAQRRGVCQDYAHILVSCCRLAGVPARYVNGFMVGEGATHAWVEIHDGSRWRGVDPTNDCQVTDDYIVLSRGRDFADCPIEAGVFIGGARQKQTVRVTVTDDSTVEWAGRQ